MRSRVRECRCPPQLAVSCSPGGASPALLVLFSLFPPFFHLAKGGLLASIPQNSIYRLGCLALSSESALSCQVLSLGH